MFRGPPLYSGGGGRSICRGQIIYFNRARRRAENCTFCYMLIGNSSWSKLFISRRVRPKLFIIKLLIRVFMCVWLFICLIKKIRHCCLNIGTRIVNNMGAPLILNAFKCKHHRRNVVKVEEDGVLDILRVLLHSHDYGLRHSRPHTLVTLLTRF